MNKGWRLIKKGAGERSVIVSQQTEEAISESGWILASHLAVFSKVTEFAIRTAWEFYPNIQA